MITKLKATTIGPPSKFTPAATRMRVLAVGEGVSWAHLTRSALLARWSAEAGHEVHYVCGARHAAWARTEAVGMVHPDLASPTPELFYQRLQGGRFFHTARELEAYVESDRRLIRRVRPDVIVSDFRLSMAISAHVEGIPLVSLLNAYWSPAWEGVFPAPRAGLLKCFPPGSRQWLFDRLRPIAYRVFATPLDRVRVKYGLPSLRDFRKLYAAGDACAYCDLPAFAPLPRLPNNHFYLGPLLWYPGNPGLHGLTETLGRTRRLAYVSTGSAADLGGLGSLVDALLDRDLDLLISGLKARKISQLYASHPRMRGRCAAATFVDPRPALSRAVLTVCHAGSGTVYQSLAHGVPLLCLPSNPDQGMVAGQVEKLHVGLTIPARSTTSRPRLNVALDRLLTERSFAHAANQMRNALAQWYTRKRWLAYLPSLSSSVS